MNILSLIDGMSEDEIGKMIVGEMNSFICEKAQTLLDGLMKNEIIDYFKIEPGKEIAEIKGAVKEAIIEGRIPYEHDAAWQYVLEIAPDILKKDKG